MTPKGLEAISLQHQIASAVASHYGYSVAMTPDDLPCPIDAVFSKSHAIVGIAEIKCRSANLYQMERWGHYLVTEAKIRNGIELSKQFGVPFLLIAALSDHALIWKLSDRTGKQLQAWDAYETLTQATVNGGQALRVNAYIPVAAAHVLKNWRQIKTAARQ